MVNHIHLISYFLTLIKPQILTAVIVDATIITVTYIVTKTKAMVFNKHHMWTKGENAVMTF